MGELVTSLYNLEYQVCFCRQWTEKKRATKNQPDILNMVSQLYDSILLEVKCSNITNTSSILALYNYMQALILLICIKKNSNILLKIVEFEEVKVNVLSSLERTCNKYFFGFKNLKF